MAIGALASDPTNPAVVYAGTGEANDSLDGYFGEGVLKSTDGGQTWTVLNPNSMFNDVDFAGLAVDPNNDQTVYATTTNGVFVSTDGGATWNMPKGTQNSAASGLVVDPSTNPSTVYVTQVGVGIEKSTDGGATFAPVGGTGLPPATEIGVTALGIGTVTSSNPNADKDLYAAIQLSGAKDANGSHLSMFKSTDGGSTWQLLKTPGYTDTDGPTFDQASYDNTIAVDPNDPNHVLAGGESLVESTDGGTSWSTVGGVHPDQHALVFLQNGAAFVGNDGGLYLYNNGSVSNLNGGLDTAQFYDLSVSAGGDQILGGLQDNGSALGIQQTSGSYEWPQVAVGDGGYTAINPLNENEQLAEADGDLYGTADDWDGLFDDIQDLSPSPCVFDTGCENWTQPIALVPNAAQVNDPTVYYGADALYQMVIGPSSLLGGTAGVQSAKALTADAGSPVSAIGVAPSNPNVVYVGFDDGTVQMSTNATAKDPTFTSITPSGGALVTGIAVDPTDPAEAVFSFSDSPFQTFPVDPSVEGLSVSLTGSPAPTWTYISGNLPSEVASDSIAYAGSGSSSVIAVATDSGVYYTFPGQSIASGGIQWDSTWAPLGSGLPNVQVLDLATDSQGNLYAATHGRGIWKLSYQLVPVPSGNPVDPDATVGDPYQSSFTVVPGTGTPPYTWQLTGGSFPPGLTPDPAGNLSGIPTAGGQFSYTVQVQDSLGYTGTVSGTITVRPHPVTITLSAAPASVSPVNTPVSLSATMSPVPDGGTVAFSECLQAQATSTCTGAPIATVPVTGSVASVVWNPGAAPPGDYLITAAYSGDADYGSVSAQLTHTLYDPGLPVIREPVSCSGAISADWYGASGMIQLPSPGDRIQFTLQFPSGTFVSPPTLKAISAGPGDVQAVWWPVGAPNATGTLTVTDIQPGSQVQPFVQDPFTLGYHIPCADLVRKSRPPTVGNVAIGLGSSSTVIPINVLADVNAHTDYDVDPVTLRVLSQPRYGHVSIEAGGSCDACMAAPREFSYTFTGESRANNARRHTRAGTGRKAAPSSDSFTYQVSNLLGKKSKPGTVTINLQRSEHPSILAANMSTLRVGWNTALTITGLGVPTPSLAEKGRLPQGVEFVSGASGIATLTGTPATGSNGIYRILIIAANGVLPNAEKLITLIVLPSTQAPHFTTPPAAGFQAAQPGFFRIATTGFPPATISERGKLPEGVKFTDTGNGTATLSGTPTRHSNGPYRILLRASNGHGQAAGQLFTLTVDRALAPPTFKSPGNKLFTVGIHGTFKVITNGNPPARIHEVGRLPSGVSLTDEGNGTAALAGTPSAATAGTYQLTLTATNGIGGANVQQSFVLRVIPDKGPPVFTSGSTAWFVVGREGHFTIKTIATPTSTLHETGHLPQGLTFRDNGNGTATLSGVPVRSDAPPADAGPGPDCHCQGGIPPSRNYSISITAVSATGQHSAQRLTLTVLATTGAPKITSKKSATFTVGQTGNFTVTASGLPTPILIESGKLPQGITFLDNGNGTATISGQPDAAGTYKISILASNNVGNAARVPFTLVVQA